MKLDELVAKYIQLRDKKGEYKSAYDAKVAKIDEALTMIEGAILNTFNETGLESIRTGKGTAYKSSRISATVADKEVYLSWVGEDFDERRVFLESRCSKDAVGQYKEMNGELPPGINWSETVMVNVRR